MGSILDILAEYGLASAVIVSCLVIIFILLKGKSTTIFSSSGGDPVSIEHQKEMELRTHDFFNNIEFKINIDLPLETFSENKNRNIMYQDLMVYLFLAYHRNMRNFVNTISSSWTTEEWSRHLNNTHYAILQEFNEECIRNGIPEIAVNIFMAWYHPYVTRIYQYISNISKISKVNAISKTNVFLLVLELILATLTADAQRETILNGQLDGLEYKGLVL